MSGGENLLRLADNIEAGKGSSKGIIISTGKGGGKGKAGKGGKLAIEDQDTGEKAEKNPGDIAKSKCKEALILLEKTDVCLNQDMITVQGSGYMTPKIRATFNNYLGCLEASKKS
jgi:hypothetical protein